MPIGMSNAAVVFQKTINLVLGNLRYVQALAFMDDVLLPAKDFDSGLARDIFKVLRAARLKVRLAKCQFFDTKWNNEIGGEGMQPGIKKTEDVSKFPELKTSIWFISF